MFWYEVSKESRRSILVHREIVEKNLGRKLFSNEVVHHIDGNPSNNTLSNLAVKDLIEHAKYHGAQRPAKMLNLICVRCTTNFVRSKRREQHNRKQGKYGPFCGKSCAAKWCREERNWLGKLSNPR
jgi:hypothetical protein